MLATLGGYLALLLGLAILLLPLLATELSRPRDSAWGAVVLLLGLVLVTTADRLSGAPMLGVLCGGLLIGRLGIEVGQGRWRLLSEEERLRLWSKERWQTSVSQASAALAQLLSQVGQVSAGMGGWLAERRQGRPATTKRWVRPEPNETTEAPGQEPSPTEDSSAITPARPPAAESPEEAPNKLSSNPAPASQESALSHPDQAQPAVIEVRSFDEIDALIETAAADEPGFSRAEPGPEPAASAAATPGPTDQPRSEAG
jgi:hypothetical protein